ncbi:MAG: N-acetylmuramoyl-L-alanine amidase [Comamonadaceae bacterium]|nr:N-acetylmuramoyl-L-alanine amidase [Comamonadaceae bacterium]
MANLPLSLQILTERTRCSAHYLVSDETPPRIYRLVDENRRAWHSGAERTGGATACSTPARSASRSCTRAFARCPTASACTCRSRRRRSTR